MIMKMIIGCPGGPWKRNKISIIPAIAGWKCVNYNLCMVSGKPLHGGYIGFNDNLCML